MKQILVAVTIISILSCKQETKPPFPTNVDIPIKETFGEAFDEKNSISVSQAIEQIIQHDSIITKVTGYVGEVCQAKGCWMVVKNAPSDTTGLFVKFKDYGFFMPLDLEDSKITMYGKAFKEITSVDELKHYAEDEGKSPEEIAAITSPQEEMKFLASGVVVEERK